jgi:hypothetical protein
MNCHWRGVITRLRLDPGNGPGIAVEIDSIAFEPSKAAPYRVD